MTKLKKTITLLIIFASFCEVLYAENLENKFMSGTELSDKIFDICKKAKVKVQTQNIVSPGVNDFPYNIEVIFDENENTSERANLIFCFRQENIYNHEEFIFEFLNFLKTEAETSNSNFTVLFSYGDEQPDLKSNLVFGSKGFISNLDENSQYSCILVNMETEEDSIILSNEGFSCPVSFVKSVYKSLGENKFMKKQISSYLSLIHKIDVYKKNEIQTSFLKSGIPCICMEFSKSTEPNKIFNILSSIAKNYDSTVQKNEESHALMLDFLGKQIWLEETTITRILLVFAFTTFLVVFILGFINSSLHRMAWRRLRRIWFYPILIYLYSCFAYYSFFLFNKFMSKIGIPLNSFRFLMFVLPLMFLTISVSFLEILKSNPHFKKRTIDYLALISSTINLFVFSLLDISLFPLFAIEFLLTLISVTLKKDWIYFIILILYELPFVPYLSELMINADGLVLQDFLRNFKLLPPLIFMLFVPQYLCCFRIYTGYNFNWFHKKRSDVSRVSYTIIFISVFVIAFETVLSFFIPINLQTLAATEKNKLPTIIISDSNHTKISTSVKTIFGESIRTIKIQIDKDIAPNLTQCELKIKGETENPVIFSENDFIAENLYETVFLIPPQPNPQMEFSYGESQSNRNSEIIFSAFYKTDNKNTYEMEQIKIQN